MKCGGRSKQECNLEAASHRYVIPNPKCRKRFQMSREAHLYLGLHNSSSLGLRDQVTLGYYMWKLHPQGFVRTRWWRGGESNKITKSVVDVKVG